MRSAWNPREGISPRAAKDFRLNGTRNDNSAEDETSGSKAALPGRRVFLGVADARNATPGQGRCSSGRLDGEGRFSFWQDNEGLCSCRWSCDPSTPLRKGPAGIDSSHLCPWRDLSLVTRRRLALRRRAFLVRQSGRSRL